MKMVHALRSGVTARSVRQPGVGPCMKKAKPLGELFYAVRRRLGKALQTRFSCILMASATVVEYFKAV